jgi:hypothetical protein
VVVDGGDGGGIGCGGWADKAHGSVGKFYSDGIFSIK